MLLRRIGTEIQIEAPAKVNLFLEILARRPDGYHDIETLIMAINLYDSLRISPAPDGRRTVACDWTSGHEARWRKVVANPFERLPPASDNLVFRAIERLAVETGVPAGIRIEIRKRIPAAAGLGGASSDAAAALVGANLLWGTGLSRAKLLVMAASLGSDMPFFVGGETLAICRGRGEQLEPLPRPGTLHLVLVRPPEGLSTALVYRHCQPATLPRNSHSIRAAVQSGNLIDIGRALHNQLQPAANGLSPGLRCVAEMMAAQDLLGFQMSGSGSSYFGICRHARHARRVAQKLRQQDVGAVFTVTTSYLDSTHPLE